MRSSAHVGITGTTPGVARVVLHGVVGAAGVDQLRMRLDELTRHGSGRVWGVVVDLSAVEVCDCRVLPVVHAAHDRMVESGRWLVVRGLAPQSLSGFEAISVAEALAVYRASLGLAEPVWPREPGWTGATGRFSDAEHQLLEFGVELATHPAGAVGGVAGRLTDWCVRALGMRAAVILTAVQRVNGAAAVVSASDERARLAAACLGSREGPVVECLQRGEPVSAPDLGLSARRRPHYVTEVSRHDVRAVRALPLRVSPVTDPGQAITVGALVLLSPVPGPMTPVDLEVTTLITALAAVALGRNPALARRATSFGSGEVAATGRRASEDRVVVERAAGVLAETERLSLPQAHSRLADLARQHGMSLGEYAQIVTDGAGAADHRVDGAAGV